MLYFRRPESRLIVYGRNLSQTGIKKHPGCSPRMLSHFLSLSDLNTSSQAAYTPSTDAAILFASSNIFLLPDDASLTLLSLLLQQLYLHHWIFVYEVTAQNAGSYMGYVTSHIRSSLMCRPGWMCHQYFPISSSDILC